MTPRISKQWRFILALEDAYLEPADEIHALRWARSADRGALSVGGELGDWAGLEFDPECAEVWYLGPNRFLLRAVCTHRTARLGDAKDSFLTREEGFRLFAELIRGGLLPGAIPTDRPGVPLLPGMDESVAEVAQDRVVEWRRHCRLGESGP